jgi:hypothetical protein
MARALDPKAKAKRQKIVAAVGGVILVALLVWRVPPMIAMMNKKPPTRSTSPAAAAPAPATPATPALPATGTAGDSGELADSDISPIAGPGQLVSFGRFVSKDPFVQQSGKRCVDSAGVTIACPPATASSSKPKRPIKEPELEVEVPAPKPPKSSARQAAQISVNGATDGVSVGGTFPASDPVFRLVSVSGKTAKIAIDGGSYASGEATITLTKGQPVTLVNTADGTRYRVVLAATG